MRVVVGDGRENVEEGLAVVASPALVQVSQSADDVVTAGRDASLVIADPTSEELASLDLGDGNRFGNLQRRLELRRHAHKRVDGLFHVLNLGQEVLGMADLETELARIVTHHQLEGVGANDAGRGVDPVEVSGLVDAVEEREPILEGAIPNLEVIHVGAELHRHKATATVEDSASGLDGGISASDGVLDDLPEASVGESLITIGNRLPGRLVVVGATEVGPALKGAVIGSVKLLAFNVERESVRISDGGDDLGETVPSLFDTGLNVASFKLMSHSVFLSAMCCG